MSVTLNYSLESAGTLTSWTFPGGERNVRITSTSKPSHLVIKCLYKSSDDLVDIILLTNAARNKYRGIPITLDIPYFPFARQDRVMVDGEPNALQAIVQVINMLDFDRVCVADPHSDVLAALFPPGKLRIVAQETVWANRISQMHDAASTCLVAPDVGASKKIDKLAKRIGFDVIQASKQRDPATGNIVATKIEFDPNKYKTLVVVDDICDGGRTFIELAAAIRDQGFTGSLTLCVTHGIFSKGLEVLDCYDRIHVYDNLSDCNINQFNSRK